MSDHDADVLSEAPDKPVVKWMERPPSSIGPMAAGGALTGAFMLGVLATLAAFAVARMIGPED